MPALAALSPEEHPCPYSSAAPVETYSERRRRRCCNRRPQRPDGFEGGRTLLVESMVRFGEPAEESLLEAALSEKHQGLRVDAPEALGIAELEFVLRYEPCRPHLTRAGRIYGAGDSVLLSMLSPSPGGASFLQGRQIQFFHRKHRFHGAFCFDGITHEFA